jgi:hypothetical protein
LESHLTNRETQLTKEEKQKKNTVLTGSNTASELIDIKSNLASILNQAKFELRKFQSNEPKVLPVDKSEICDPNVPLNNITRTRKPWGCIGTLLPTP